MNKAFQKMLAKKQADMPEGRMKARSSVLDDLIGNMDDRESNKLGMGKVSVMSDSPEGLKEGLNKAKDVVDQVPDMEDSDMPEHKDMMMSDDEESPEHESEESPELEDHEDHDKMIQQKLMEKIAELEARLAKLGA